MKKSGKNRNGRFSQESHQQQEVSGSLWTEPVVHILLLVMTAFVTYWNSMTVPFTFDDAIYVINNPLIRALSNFWSTPDFSSITVDHDVVYNFALRPVAYFTFAVNYLLGGLNPAAMHLVNILIHLSATVMAYFVTRLLIISEDSLPESDDFYCSHTLVPFFTAFIFAVHPIQTQAVTYIVQRFTALVGLFYLLTLVLYCLYRRAPQRTARMVWYSAAVIAAVGAMKTKENAFTVPVVILLMELMFFKGDLKKRIVGLVPFFLTMAIIPATVARLSAGSSGSGIVEKGTNLVNYGGYATSDYLITQFRVLVTYLQLLILPINQNLDHDFPLFRSLLDYRILLSLILLSALLGLGLWLMRRSFGSGGADNLRLRLVSFGIFWFFITLSIESSIIPLEDLIVEHRLYLPSFGIFLAIVAVIDMLRTRQPERQLSRNRAATALLGAIVVVLAIATIKRNHEWHNIWADVVAKSPEKLRGYKNLGAHYLNIGRFEEAAASFRHIIEKQHDHLGAHLYLGIALSEQKKFREARDEIIFVLERSPQDPIALEALGTIEMHTGDPVSAIRHFEQALAINPQYERARNSLRQALAKLESG